MNILKKIEKTLKKTKIRKKDKILVALSGGKDSTMTAYSLKKLGYNIQGFHINLGLGKYSDRCLNAIKKLCSDLDIKLHVYDIKEEMGSSMCYLRSRVQTKNKKEGKTQIKNCAICGVIKKSVMNKQARELKAKYLATGHNLDDESQTFLMNIFKGSPELSANLDVVTNNPKGVKNSKIRKFIPRLKPLFYIPENKIRKFTKKNKLPVVYEKCPCAISSYRIQIRKFVKTLSDKKKQNIVKNFESLKPRIRKIETSDMNLCNICGEPCRGNVCKMCELTKDV